jgi:hypothetical protein
MPSSCPAKWAVSRNHNISFVRTSVTPRFSLAVNRCTEEMSSRIHTRCVDVVVFCVFAHLCEALVSAGREPKEVSTRTEYGRIEHAHALGLNYVS